MTDHKPEPAPYILRIALDDEALRRATARLTEQFARMRFRNAARAALIACLDGDDQQAARLLDDCLDAQLYAIEGAASGLAIHASRLRKALAEQDDTEALTAQLAETWRRDLAERQAEQDRPAEQDGADDEQPDDESTCDNPDCVCHDLCAPAEDEQPGEATDNLAPWERDLIEQQAADERLVEILARRDADHAAELRAVQIDRDQWRDRAHHWKDATVSATDAFSEQRQRAARANVQATALLRRAETAERQAAEQKKRAQRAEADAADWRTTAHGYEQALRAEQDKARAALNNAEVSIYTTIEAARSEGVDLNDMTAFQLTAAIAERLRDGDGQAKALDLRTIISDQPDQFRDWLRAELRRDPGWWREILRRELRLGWLRDDFRRAGLA